MDSYSVLKQPLKRRDVATFFLFATFAFVLPLLLADYIYIDDGWRSLRAGMAWAEQGRVLADMFYNVLTFSLAAPNIFPLPLLLATVAFAMVLTSLTFHYYESPDIFCCLVVLPLLYNPFFLQNLSYQYDGPVMMLSLVAVIYAISCQFKSMAVQALWSGALVAAGMALYQLSVNVFLGLCCIEFIRYASNKVSLASLVSLVIQKCAQLIVAAIFYFLTAYPFIGDERTAFIKLDSRGIWQIGDNLSLMARRVGLLFNGGYFWLYLILLVVAACGCLLMGARIFQADAKRWERWTIALGCLALLPVLLVLVSGAALVFRVFNDGARTLMGFAVVLVFLFYASHHLLRAIHPRLGLLLAIPLLSTLSLSYAYGRVLSVQKEFETSALSMLAQDIASRKSLREAKRIYMAISYSDGWLGSSTGSLQVAPVLNYILNIEFLMLSESLPRLGITNVVTEPERGRQNATLVGYRGYTPVVDSKFYKIYLVGDYGFVVIKDMPPPERIRW